jgi:hypothetical protein
MILTKSEFLSSLQNEVRILLHLASKVDNAMLDYRPTPKQRSLAELLSYLSMMGPMMTKYGLSKGGEFDRDAWMAAADEAEKRDLEQKIAAIAGHTDEYKKLLADVTDADLRSEMTGFDGSKMTRGSYMVDSVLCSCAAYRLQLFMYLKSCGQEQLGTSNLWRGADAPVSE